MQFHPLDPAALPMFRRALLPALPAVARIERWFWSHCSRSRSTWFDSRRWRAVWNVVRWFGAVPRKRPDRMVVRFAPRIVLDLDLSRLTDVLALCYGPGENEIGYVCQRICPPDGVVADIGGNIGTTALAFAAAVPKGRVHVFEPSPEMLVCLRRNIALSGADNVTVHPCGLADRSTRANLQVAIPGNPGSAFLTETPAAQGTEVEVQRLDDVLATTPRLDFVKIDVEGLELQVLRGAEQVIRRHRPVVLFELNEPALQRGGTTGRETAQFLEGLDYRLLWLDRGRFRDYVVDGMSGRTLHNVLAVPREKPLPVACN